MQWSACTSPHRSLATCVLLQDRALNKERISHQTAQYQRDQLRADHNKLNEIYRLRQDKVETQIVQIDKLNSVINACEGAGACPPRRKSQCLTCRAWRTSGWSKRC